MSHLMKPEGQLSDRIETFDVAPLFFPPICFVSMHLSRFLFFSSFFPLPPFHPPLIISPHPQSRSRHNGAVVWRFWKELMETTSLLSSHSCARTCARAHTRALLWIGSITVLDLLHLLNSTHLFIHFLHQPNEHLNIMLKCNILLAKRGHFLSNEDILSGPQNFKDMFVGGLVCKLELVGIGFMLRLNLDLGWTKCV